MPARLRVPVRLRVPLAAAAALAVSLSVLGSTSGAQATDGRAGAGAVARAEAPPSYVALGDSYSANVWVRPWDDSDGCGRSARSWPRQVAAELGLDLTDVTCGAAEVQDGILGPQPSDKILGPPTLPPEGGWPEKPPQLDALGPDTDYVTVGIGGNTLGFGSIVTQCLERGLATLGFGTPCTKYFTEGDGREWLEDRFAQLDREYDAMMTAIGERAPEARVLVVGYPAIIPHNSGCTWGVWRQLGTVARGDMPWLDGVERELNDRIGAQAADHGATYVDTYASSAAHGLCEPAAERWMYGVKDDLTGDGDQTDPPSEFCEQIPGNGEACTFVHPNAAGADNQARQVKAAFEGLLRTAPPRG
ncbi:SGNH/GDSL hydrolase family protein [Streptomyces liangshanensis]|uniref:SGNH/GDSL hydrolase family protein n=1 Tax=Streptomyces liangshanensis TaxID=2717324 RepID=UPI0036D84DBB